MLKIMNDQKASNFDSDVFWVKSTPSLETETPEQASVNCNIIERCVDFIFDGLGVNKENVKFDNKFYDIDIKSLVDNNMNEIFNICSSYHLLDELNVQNYFDNNLNTDKMLIE